MEKRVNIYHVISRLGTLCITICLYISLSICLINSKPNQITKYFFISFISLGIIQTIFGIKNFIRTIIFYNCFTRFNEMFDLNSIRIYVIQTLLRHILSSSFGIYFILTKGSKTFEPKLLFFGYFFTILGFVHSVLFLIFTEFKKRTNMRINKILIMILAFCTNFVFTNPYDEDNPNININLNSIHSEIHFNNLDENSNETNDEFKNKFIIFTIKRGFNLINPTELIDCPICLNSSEPTNTNPLWIKLECGHFTHAKCLETYLIKSCKSTCPMCRQDFLSCGLDIV